MWAGFAVCTPTHYSSKSEECMQWVTACMHRERPAGVRGVPLRPRSTLLSPCTRATTGRKGVLYKEEDLRFLAGRASPGLRFVWEMGGRSRACYGFVAH